jgi:nicotinamide-nucleotide adenylyltransferase
MASVSQLVRRVQSGGSPVEFVHFSHPRWPLLRRPDASPPATPLRISLLDSSFNPPTLAHLALARASPGDARAYDAHLLVLSVRNVDKALKPGDAVYEQRLAMMIRLGAHLGGAAGADPEPAAEDAQPNAAVAILDEPTFVGKADVLRRALDARLDALAPEAAPAPTPAGADAAGPRAARVHLAFLLGFDTLERLFAPRYYPSADEMHARLGRFFADCAVVCAWRGAAADAGADADAKAREDATMRAAHGYLESGRIRMIDIGAAARAMSSTDVRKRRAGGDDAWREMVTPDVAEYVEGNGLYGPEAN